MTEAEKLARKNTEKNIDTVLFFDEANTTDAIDLIKEIMVDKRLNGCPLQANLHRLHFIAACNPYRKYVIVFNSIFDQKRNVEIWRETHESDVFVGLCARGARRWTMH